MKSRRSVAGLLVLGATVAVATTIVPHTLRQRAEVSDRVALVQVLSQRVEETPDAQFPIKTYTTVAVGHDFRGRGPSELTIVQIGGTVGQKKMEIPGDAKFNVGETAVVFLRCKLAVDRCHLVAMGAGKLNVDGENVFVQDLTTQKWRRVTLAQFPAEIATGVQQ
ncbi:MAG: hypothetical protein QM817_08530 [Archangium sp.]